MKRPLGVGGVVSTIGVLAEDDKFIVARESLIRRLITRFGATRNEARVAIETAIRTCAIACLPGNKVTVEK